MSRRNSLLLPLALALTAFVMAAPVSVQARRAPGPATRAEAAPQDSAGAQDSAAVQPLDTTVAVNLAIPAADIPRRAEETSVELREMLGRLQPEQDLNAQASAVQDLLFRLGRKRTEFERLDVDELSARALEDLRQEWLAFQFQLNRWQGPLVAQGEGIVAERLRLREIKEIWSETLRSASSMEMPPALVQRAESVLQAQEAVLGRVRFERDVVLTLQDQISEEILAVAGVIQEIDQARERKIGGLLTADAPTLWVALRTQRDSASAVDQARTTVGQHFSQIRDYFANAAVTYGRSRIWTHLGLFLGLALLLTWFRYLSRGWSHEDPDLKASARILSRPFSAAFLIALIFSRDFYPTAPLALFDLNRLVLLVPVLRLLPEAAVSRMRSTVYVVAALFVLDSLSKLAFPDSLLARIMAFAWSVTAFVAVAWLAKPKGALNQLGSGFWVRAALFLGRVVALMLLIAAVANILGYINFASYLSSAALAAAYGAIVLYAAYLVLGGAWRAILRTKMASNLMAIRVHTATAERRGLALLRWAAFVFWVLFESSMLGFGDDLISAVSSALTSGFEVGSVTISLGSVLAFLIAIWLAVIFSGVIRALLAEDVLPKTKQARAADSIATLVYWAVLLAGFLFAAAAAGFEIGRLTLLAGAFGVGIGFGLQDVVNNFVSGLILAFERPIQVGDIVDIGTLQGTVSRIGMRSSVVRTFQGAEVIVPNSNLISNPMTNWTRSDRLRRVEIPVGVAYGTDQRDVFKVLMEVAKDHPDILEHPEPSVLLRGFGDSSLNFELRFWTYRFDGFLRVQSEVTRVILDALKNAGITIPFPQRDLHVKSVAPEARQPAAELELPNFSDPGEA
ncbi:MAG: mechanosensitive ion channel [Gemmatimonadales bacterium]